MKKLGIALFCLVMIAIIVIGKFHYDSKLETIAQQSQEQHAMTIATNEQLQLMDNMDAQLKDNIIRKIKDGETITLLVVGSTAITTADAEELSWPLQLKEALDEYYGGGTFQLETLNFEDISTYQLLETNGHEKVAAHQPDILILEPLLLNDNGVVKVEDTLQNVIVLLDTVKEEVADVFIILQPANPLHQTPVYVEQIEALKQFAHEHQYEFFDHWEVWSDHEEELKDYVAGMYPTEKGHELWATFIMDYFISRK